LVVVICLLGINWITAGEAGFGFLHKELYGPTWLGTIALAVGMVASILTLLAWHKPARTAKKKSRRQVTRRESPPLFEPEDSSDRRIVTSARRNATARPAPLEMEKRRLFAAARRKNPHRGIPLSAAHSEGKTCFESCKHNPKQSPALDRC